MRGRAGAIFSYTREREKKAQRIMRQERERERMRREGVQEQVRVEERLPPHASLATELFSITREREREREREEISSFPSTRADAHAEEKHEKITQRILVL